jgi:hypothetical protein
MEQQQATPVVSERLGHANPDVTEHIYSHILNPLAMFKRVRYRIGERCPAAGGIPDGQINPGRQPCSTFVRSHNHAIFSAR